MLKLYANIFQLKESNLTRSSLNRLWIFALLSLPFVPLFLLLRLNLASEFPQLETLYTMLDGRVGYGVFILSFLAWVALLSTRLINRFWVRDRYLDEWELQIKRKSMTFAFQAIAYLLVLIFLVILAVQNFSLVNGVAISMLTASVTLLFIAMYAQIFFLLFKLRPIDANLVNDTRVADIAST